MANSTKTRGRPRGLPKTGGRQKGTPNKVTRVLKDAILQAATDAGDGDMVAYLKAQALANPGPFMALLGKVLPTQIEGQLEQNYIARLPAPVADVDEWQRQYDKPPTH
jgi:hypothetical protein